MTVKELIQELSQYEENLQVDTNNGIGTYTDITNVKVQEWRDREGCNHKVVALMINGYDSKKSIVD